MKRTRYVEIKLPFHRLRAQDCLPFQQRGLADLVLEESVARQLAGALFEFFLGDCSIGSISSEPSTEHRAGHEVSIQQYKLKRKKKNSGGGKHR